jgi:cytochrome c-type biogenesis protein CcmH
VNKLALLLTLLLAQPLLADSNLPPAYWANRELPSPQQEAQAQELMEQIRCLVCQGQSIADSDAELAGDMRDMVRRRIAAGEKPAEIRAWLIQRYGTWISYKPTEPSSAISHLPRPGSGCPKHWLATARARMPSEFSKMRSNVILATRSSGSASAMRSSTMRAD